MVIDFAVNYLAVAVAAVASGVIGMLYYGAAGLDDRLGKMIGVPRSGTPSPTQLATGLVVGLVNAWVLAVLSLNLGGSSIADGVLLGVLVWIGFGATFKAAQVAFEGRSWNAWVLTGVHDLIVEVVVAVIVTVWR